MSLSIENLKFTIFGSGHDFTRVDSGEGDNQIFSHLFVPLGSVNYAGQYYFLVPDENGEPLDCVKDDIAHCTFTPALGTTFDTEGETTVECHYYREYALDTETLVVDKTVTQKITVVDHGAVVDSTNNLDVYSDGYGFIRPLTVNGVEVKDYSITQKNAVTKLSSFPWRATGLGAGVIYGFFKSRNLNDVSEFAFADTSKCTKFYSVFDGDVSLTDISAVATWDVSSVQTIRFFVNESGINSLEPLKNWTTPALKNLERAFQGYNGTSLDGLQNFDVSNVENMANIFDGNGNLTDATAISKWNMAKVKTLTYAFYNSGLSDTDAFASWNVESLVNISYFLAMSSRVKDLSGLSNWVANLTTIAHAFDGCTAISDISGVRGLDVHLVSDFSSAFESCRKLLSLDGLETWDFSSGVNFLRMFKDCPWLSDISALANADFTHGTNFGEMFSGCNSILNVDTTGLWAFTTNNVGNMFKSNYLVYSSKIDKWLLENAYYYYDYSGRQYTPPEVADEDYPLTYPTYDADVASQWSISGSNLNVFDGKWTNTPAWN